MRYLIVGAGPAGVIAAETLRRQDPQGQILLINGESEPVYSRMAIPYFLSEKIDESGTHLRHAPDHFERLNIELVQDRAAALDAAGRRLRLESGGSRDYDRLLLASGSRAVAPPIPGLEQPGIHHCWTLEDARRIARRATPGSRVVLIGAGFIGCIILEALVERGVRLTVLETGDRMVPRMMDQSAGNLIKQWCQARGVEVHTSTTVKAIQPGFQVECEGLAPIAADLVVVATGVRPNLEYLAGSGVDTDQGVVVNRNLQTSVPGVYAAGDLCQSLDWSTGAKAVHAIQPAAAEQGRIAALNMAGQATQYPGSLSMNVLDTLGLISTSMGLWMGVDGGEQSSLLDADGYRYLQLQFQEDRLVGAVSLGLTQHVGVLRGMIQTRLRLGHWKQRLMADPTRVMEAYLACTQFPQEGAAAP
jgi:NADPH-dependent 2,4-dienoyl-CoA reductase/sulfur reductase-like enzyme